MSEEFLRINSIIVILVAIISICFWTSYIIPRFSETYAFQAITTERELIDEHHMTTVEKFLSVPISFISYLLFGSIPYVVIASLIITNIRFQLYLWGKYEYKDTPRFVLNEVCIAIYFIVGAIGLFWVFYLLMYGIKLYETPLEYILIFIVYPTMISFMILDFLKEEKKKNWKKID